MVVVSGVHIKKRELRHMGAWGSCLALLHIFSLWGEASRRVRAHEGMCFRVGCELVRGRALPLLGRAGGRSLLRGVSAWAGRSSRRASRWGCRGVLTPCSGSWRANGVVCGACDRVGSGVRAHSALLESARRHDTGVGAQTVWTLTVHSHTVTVCTRYSI